MPSTSKKQHNFMGMVANNPKMAKKVGVPQSVGKDFSEADKGKKFGVGGNVNYTFGGKGQLNKQRTRGGSIDGYQKDVPDVNINKYAGKKAGGAIRADLQATNKKKTDHGDTKLFKEGGTMKSVDMKKNPGVAKLPTAVRNKMGFMKKGGMAMDAKEDMKMDKKVVKKAVGMHDKQQHEGKKTNLTTLKKGGMACAPKKMAKGGGIESKGKTKGRMC